MWKLAYYRVGSMLMFELSLFNMFKSWTVIYHNYLYHKALSDCENNGQRDMISITPCLHTISSFHQDEGDDTFYTFKSDFCANSIESLVQFE